MIFISLALVCLLITLVRKAVKKDEHGKYQSLVDKYELVVLPEPLMKLEDGSQDLEAVEHAGDEYEEEKETCWICMDQLEEAQMVLKLDCCEHSFHSTCVLAWSAKTKSTSCPCCTTYALPATTMPTVIVVN